ncbi:amidohydrolase [Proteobacteria bacterium 005FR1]|nr:amidohydrolase [Proteobacteria bacterium 005FR1]
MQDLVVTIVQESIVWENPQANRDKFGQLLQDNCRDSDLVLLPEMFTTGFNLKSTAQAETMSGPTVQWMLEKASELNADVAGSVKIKDGERFFNRLIWAKPDGSLQTYDKRHLFSFAGEDKIYTPGKERVIIDCKGWRCCPQICYDLRFPVWSRNRKDYDVLIYVANWPKVRVGHWTSLLTARAIENLSYTVGVNRVGEDGNGHAHNGQSAILGPKGKPLVEPGSRAGCYTMTLDYAELQRYRNKFKALDDGDDFKIL